MSLLKCIIIYYGLNIAFGDNSVIIDTKLEKIEGEIIETTSRFKVDAFRGIPYAKPPVGELRFEKPQKTESWDKVHKATDWGNRCLALSMGDEQVDKMMGSGPGEESEDCLFLNIFAPHTKSSDFPSGYPVMFWIHGGGLIAGSSAEYGMKGIAEYLVSKNVIIITINYRLSLLGTFTTGDKRWAGNLALWDMAAALYWVNDHIKSFGGDVNRITVFGESAGGFGATALSISPHTNKHFQQAIVMSGNVLSPWGVRDQQEVADHSKKVANHFGCIGSSTEIINCMRKVPAKDIENANPLVESLPLKSTKLFPMGVVYDGDFFPKDLLTLFKEAPKIPTIAGVTEMEGGMWAFPLFPLSWPWTMNNMSTFNIDEFAQKADIILKPMNLKNYGQVKKALLEKYAYREGRVPDRVALLKQYALLVGEDFMVRGVVNENQIKLNNDWPIWFYKFEYSSEKQFPDDFEIKSSFHGMELTLLFAEADLFIPYEFEQIDYDMIETFTTLWTNFAKFGDPTPESYDGVKWEKRTKENRWNYLNIDEKLEMRDSYGEDIYKFWFKTIPEIEKGKIKEEF